MRIENAPNKEAAERNAHAAQDANPWLAVPKIHDRVYKVMQSDATRTVKRRKLFQIIDAAHHALAPYTACRQGCSHCCNIAVLITQDEARTIAEYTGRTAMSLPPMTLDIAEAMQQDKAGVTQYRGVPCPFLADDQCSVYVVRPAPCRQHHSLDDTPEQCSLSIDSEVSSVPSYNVNLPGMALAHLTIEAGESLGDIREYFPTTTQQGNV